MGGQPRKPKFQPATKEEARAACEASGYPIELRVAAICREAAFEPLLNWTWMDRRQGKLRELDVAASLERWNRWLILQVHALVECKRFASGCVVFGGALGARSVEDHVGNMDGHAWGQPSAIANGPGAISGPLFQNAVGWSRGLWPLANHIGTQFAKLVGGEEGKPLHATHADLFESIDGLTRGALAFRKEAGKAPSDFVEPFFNLAALFVVIDGPLYFYSVGSDGKDPSFDEVQQASVLVRTIDEGRRWHFRVDFVQLEHASALFKELRRAADAIAADLMLKGDLLRESVARFGHTDREE